MRLPRYLGSYKVGSISPAGCCVVPSGDGAVPLTFVRYVCPLMTPLNFAIITERLAKWPFPPGIDGVVGIATGGVVPAALVAQHLQLELKLIALNYRDEANVPRQAQPTLLAPVPDLGKWRRVLLVDDVYVSGSSWRAARALLPADVEVLPFVFKGKVDFALIQDVDGCVQWPWRVYD